jgi:eukaryotic-like serine/threonine-protein kinase
MASWDAARWRAVSDAIDRILDLPPPERGPALEALRQRDAALAADVARLLAEQPAMEAGRFLEGGAAAALPTATSDAGLAGPRPAVTLPPGATFGGYRIHRLLGRGGMGIVYEAEELESGRRVALKILQQRFDDARDRERFRREGQLAASIDHEHCVFVFGASEVDGTPSIAMELMEGTLADRLGAQGPLPPAATVDAALQLVAGLQAAQAAGILHRDVKPSNCFVDAHDVVKIGDFGISRSTRPAQETTHATRGLVAATPAYASPEQLRGAVLDVRSDIYSLGATLYELLTGQRPFTAPDLIALLMAVANDLPRPPHSVLPAVPKGLSHVVLRCLAKKPEDRFRTYDDLAAALEPYASWSPTAATLGRRLLAGTIDLALLTFFLAPATAALMLTRSAGFDRRSWIVQLTVAAVVSFLYYGLSERRWGATVGKAFMGLTLVDAQSRPPGTAAALIRSGVFLGPSIISGIASIVSAPAALDVVRGSITHWGVVQWATYWSVLAVLFATARRRNAYAGLHDLLSRTRVVTSASRSTRAARASASASFLDPNVHASMGPVTDVRGAFAVLPGSIDGRPGWRPGFDTRLGRRVWIRDLEPGAPPVDAFRASLTRETRLRWLAGRRTEHEAWDVYEAVDGVPLPRALESAPDWATARTWMADLARELASQDTRDRPPLSEDRIWVVPSGRMKLLDDPTEDDVPDAGGVAPGPLLHGVMERLHRRARTPWPLSATVVLDDARSVPPSSLVARLDALRRADPAITPLWRGAACAAASSVVTFALAVGMTGSALLNITIGRPTPEEQVARAGVRLLRTDMIAARWGFGPENWRRLSDRDRHALEVFLAYRYHPALVSQRIADNSGNLLADDDKRAIVDRVLRRAPVTAIEGDVASANPRVRAIVQRTLSEEPPSFAEVFLFGLLVCLAANGVFALILAVACRGVCLRLLGFEIVANDGRRATRARVTSRALLAWSPVLVLPIASWVSGHFDETLAESPLVPVSLLVFVAGAAYAIASPSRGIQDRLAGTWIVPR